MTHMMRRRVVVSAGITLLALLMLVPLALAQGAVSVQVVENETLGPILTDAEGMTLYMFTRDTPNQTNCYDNCAVAWPPLLVEAGTAASAGEGVTGNLGVIERTDGTMMVTYNDMPLYYYAEDVNPGDVNGQGVGDVWFVVHPDAPSVEVSDQALENDTVTIDRVVAFEPGWLVVHADNGGSPGPVVGHSALEPGENQDVQVELDAEQATPTLFAMLHVDRGEIGTYEFPGADGPVTLAGQVVTPPFEVTGGIAESAGTEATESGEQATETQPEALPQSGGSMPAWPLILLAAGLAALVAGLGLSFARRTR